MEKAEAKLELITGYFSGLSAKQEAQFAALDGLYHEWNSRINVISRKDLSQLYENHVLHSLSLAAAFRFGAGQEVIDIGTGGGFPGIPLAIFFPETSFHLVDSIGKKIKVVNAIAEATGLANITTAHMRAEEIRGRKFDLAISRAVAPLRELWTWSRPLLRKPALNPVPEPPAQELLARGERVQPHGLVCLKGGDLAGEIAETGRKATVLPIHKYFNRPYFEEKSIVYLEY